MILVTRFSLIAVIALVVSACGSNEPLNARSNSEPAETRAAVSNSNHDPGVSVEVDSLAPANEDETSSMVEILRLEKERRATIPYEFQQVDFRNFSFPMSGRKAIKLTDGVFESQYDPKDCDNSFDKLNGVYYADLDGDKKQDALVDLVHVSCGCGSCDGGHHILYAFRLKGGQPKLFWRYFTGSYGYGGGLRSLHSRPGSIEIEEFEARNCSEKATAEDVTCFSKGMAKNYVRSTLKFTERTFVQKSTVEIATDPIDVLNYEPSFDVSKNQ